jgi:superfamily II DNA or RNA helicase
MREIFRYYQAEADKFIYEELLINNKCIVKMFCGTGKSLIMRKCKSVENKKLVVYVFPSLCLIDQFYSDYLNDFPTDNILKISSECESTTEPIRIRQFLSLLSDKIICITYQSFKTLLDNLGETKINVCVFDEAHHAVGETYQKLIFENDLCEKQIFFTATPKNANGIVMYDRENIESGMCGNLVYDYSYLRGMNEGYLNPFEIRIDMYTENNNKSILESIARAILSSSNSRVLTFHSSVSVELGDTSVMNFVNEEEFKKIFEEVRKKEFPKSKKPKKISMIALTASIPAKQRKKYLDKFDNTKDNEVYIIASCETIGEGIDTKNANMCVFVDPKSSYVKIIQNIGRIVRKQFGVDKQNSTILIPCWVDKTKYLDCQGDKDKCDEVIREDMSADGNFNGILNVLSALKQEDEDLYDICLHYPDTYSPQEIKSNLQKQGYTIGDVVGEGSLQETIEHLLEIDEENYEDYSEEQMIMKIAEENDVCIEIHTNSFENPIETYNGELKGDSIRLYKSFDEDTEEDIYQPIIQKETRTKRNSGSVKAPKRENRLGVKVHTNPDIKVLWNITSDLDLTKDICSCVIDCEVVDNWFERLEELKQFIDANERRPSSKSKEKTEKKMGCWLQTQQQNYKKKIQAMKDKCKYDLWSIVLEEYRKYLLTDDEKWYKTFEEVKLFIDTNKKRPTTATTNEKLETKLGWWIIQQIQNYKKKDKSMKDVVKYNLWTEFEEKYHKYLLSDEEKWYDIFEELKLFININKKRPSTTSKDNIEKKLGLWIGTQQQKFTNRTQCMKNEKIYNLWTMFVEEYKEYLLTNDERWYDIFEELKVFITANKKRPLQKSIDKTEKQLGIWISNQQNCYKNKIKSMTDQTKYSLWTDFVEEYKEFLLTKDEIWYDSFEKLKKFIDISKRRPSSTTLNKIENQLGVWLSQINIKYNKKISPMKDQTKYTLWTEFKEEYKEYLLTDEEKWYENFEELKLFIDENKKRPSHCSKNLNEKKKGRWLISQTQNFKKKSQAMKDETKYNLWTKFLEEYKEYLLSDLEKWYGNFEQLKVFMDKTSRRPISTSTNYTETQLNAWLQNQQHKYKNKFLGMNDEKRYNLWTEFLEKYHKYLLTDDDIWYETFEKLKIFISTNKKRPSQSSKNKKEKGLAGWISHQLVSHKEKQYCMKDETKYDLWTEFVEEYKDILNFKTQKPIVEDTQSEETESTIEEEKPKKIKSMKLKTPSKTKETTLEKKVRVKSEISELHREYKTLKSENLHNKFQENPDLWTTYHEISEENEKSFPEEEIPRNRVIQQLDKTKTKRTKRIVDLGCGKGQISQYYKDDKRFQFHNYDHISSNDTIISCDISNIPLEEDSVEMCILSLAMWGSNCREYIQEANRILETGGRLYIIEPTKRWSEKDELGNIVSGREGNKLKLLLEENSFQILEQSVDKFCMFVCITI